MGSLFHAEESQILRAAVQNLVAPTTRWQGFVQQHLKDGFRQWLPPLPSLSLTGETTLISTTLRYLKPSSTHIKNSM